MKPRLTYGSYLHLDDLLGAARPLSSPGDRALWTAERFFIVCHQVSELWISQAFADIRLAIWLIDRGEPAASCDLIARATSEVELAALCLVELWRLDLADFLAFRPRLAGASGAQSDQFSRLLQGVGNPLIARLIKSLDRTADPGHVVLVRRHLDDFLDQVARWRCTHLELVRHFIAGRPGTGGTSGVAYLADRTGTQDLGRPLVNELIREGFE